MTLWDHLFFAVVFFVIPFYSWRSYAPWVVDVDARGEPARIAGYRETLSIWFVAAIALIVLWLTTGREWSELGLRLSHPTNFALGAVLGLGLTAFIWWQVSIFVSKVLGGSVTREQLREQIGTTEAVMPGTQRELNWFRAVSVNAGITEELICRAFLLWYLEPYVGLPAAAIIAIGLFALGHSYQGLKQLPGIAMVAGAMVALYLISGSIWLPMLVHALIDAIQGSLLAAGLRSQQLAMQE